jgi:hypothetical protein
MYTTEHPLCVLDSILVLFCMAWMSRVRYLYFFCMQRDLSIAEQFLFDTSPFSAHVELLQIFIFLTLSRRKMIIMFGRKTMYRPKKAGDVSSISLLLMCLCAPMGHGTLQGSKLSGHRFQNAKQTSCWPSQLSCRPSRNSSDFKCSANQLCFILLFLAKSFYT